MITRRKIAMLMAEFLGAAVLTLVVLAVAKSSAPLAFFIAVSAAAAAGMGMLVFGHISGAHFNPAVTLAMLSARKVKVVPAVVYIAAQMLGGAAAYLLFSYIIGQTWQNHGTVDGKMIAADAAGALILGLGWAAIVYERMETARAAGVVALSLTLAMSISLITGGMANPAVALGTHTFTVATALAPVLGVLIGFNLYGLLCAPLRELAKTAKQSGKK